MRIERVFTTAGSSPYDGIEFRTATSEIKNPDGSVVFKLDEIDVPFELKNLKDHATYTKPYQRATGWDYVIVNGKPVITAGKLTEATPGQQIINR